MMIPVNRDNLRDALIAVAVGATLAWLLSGCAGQRLTQVATLAPTLAPKVTGAMILAQQPPAVQQAITQHAQAARWPSFSVGRS
jgi:hypothetical protein